MADSLQQQVAAMEERLELIETRLEQLFDHLDLKPREGGDAEIDPASDPEIQDLLTKGNALQAAKRYQERTGASLEQAKQAIDEAQADG
jgi:ribosomal protein L7/L12